MESEELYTKLKGFFPKHLDLMRHLHINACWEYIITEHSIDDTPIKLIFYLFKKNEKSLEMTKNKPEFKPDLILYFTENAILAMIEGTSNAEEYYERYRNVMENPQPGIELDSKVNKPRLKLWQIGYKQWQKDFKF
ncbi:MAG: hypothetical protein KGD70_03515 [Candidatus Lokiarchaeota archaeon]|jgi:hypothetical protein|nr:hypothetical protein [Candidatus Lokiarchaeota archaeon]